MSKIAIVFMAATITALGQAYHPLQGDYYPWENDEGFKVVPSSIRMQYKEFTYRHYKPRPEVRPKAAMRILPSPYGLVITINCKDGWFPDTAPFDINYPTTKKAAIWRSRHVICRKETGEEFRARRNYQNAESGDNSNYNQLWMQWCFGKHCVEGDSAVSSQILEGGKK